MALFANKKVILAGDFNIPSIDWRNPASFFDVDTNPLVDIMICVIWNKLLQSIPEK